jgi:toxin ParE1/3/4
MSRPRYSPPARDDLRDIARHYAEVNRTYGVSLVESIRNQCRQLARFPGMGRPRDDLKPGLRSFALGQYLIFFMPTDDGVAIVRVLHGARDITPAMFDFIP